MKTHSQNLIVVAHPDDETIYFTGPILKNRDLPWKVICVTDGNADGKGSERKKQLETACQLLGVAEFEQWDYPDVFENRLNVSKLEADLARLPAPANVYTHGIIGEYSHPHHQDVSYAVHRCFTDAKMSAGNPKLGKVMSIGYNTFPDEVFELTRTEFDLKTKILSETYADEMSRFLHLVPATSVDSFSTVKLEEIEAIYRFLIQKSGLSLGDLDKYRWLHGHITTSLGKPNKRLF